MINLNGKTVLVTGGSHGIGAAAVRQIVSCGGKVIIHHGANKEAAENLTSEVGEDNVLPVQDDLLSIEATEKLWNQAETWQGGAMCSLIMLAYTRSARLI